MSDLDQVKGLIARGEKQSAVALLASTLLSHRDDLEAWLLMGDTIEEPSRKQDCYKQALRLAPRNFHALTRLQELKDVRPDGRQYTSAEELDVADERPTKRAIKPVSFVPDPASTAHNKTTSGGEIIGYVLGGLAGFLIILYVIGSPSPSSSDSNTLYVGLLFLSLIAGVIILTVSSKHRS